VDFNLLIIRECWAAGQ